MSKSSLKEQKKTRRKSSDSSPTSFSSLPYDVALNCLARVSGIHYTILSLVSKSFRSLVASPDLEATRSRIGKTKKCLCICLNMKNNPNPSWCILLSTPKHKLIPVRSFPGKYPSFSAVASVGSGLYIIGGTVTEGKRSRRVYLFDCTSHQWRRVPKMCVARKEALADVFDGKIYVRGGCSNKYRDTEVFSEVYDPITQTWEPCSGSLKGVGRFMSDSTLVRASLSCAQRLYYACLKRGFHCNNRCVVVAIEKNDWCKTRVSRGTLVFSDLKLTSPWPRTMESQTRVAGLEEMSSNKLITVLNSSGGGRRVTVWWHKMGFWNQTSLWCAEISLERRTDGVIWGVVEWSENVFTLPYPHFFFGQTAIVTHEI